MFAIIKAFGVDTTYINRTTFKNDINDIETIAKTSKEQIEEIEKVIKYEKEIEQYNIDHYKWEEECRKLREKAYKDVIKYDKALLKHLAKGRKLIDVAENGKTEEIREAAKKEYAKNLKFPMKFPKSPIFPKEPVKPEFRF